MCTHMTNMVISTPWRGVSCPVFSVLCPVLCPMSSLLCPVLFCVLCPVTFSCVLSPVSCFLYLASCVLCPVLSPVPCPVSWFLCPVSCFRYPVSCFRYPVWITGALHLLFSGRECSKDSLISRLHGAAAALRPLLLATQSHSRSPWITFNKTNDSYHSKTEIGVGGYREIEKQNKRMEGEGSRVNLGPEPGL